MATVEACLGATINAEHKEQMLSWFRDCPREILDRHPTAMLVYARRLYTFHMQKECIEVLQYLRSMLQENRTISEQLRRNILGEIEVNESFLGYNDVEAMSVHHRKACELLDCPTTSVAPNSPWAFGGVSALLDYHRRAGELEREMEIASLAADRKTNREIAQTLHLSENTVKSTLRIIFQKLGMEDGGRGKKRELERILRGT